MDLDIGAATVTSVYERGHLTKLDSNGEYLWNTGINFYGNDGVGGIIHMDISGNELYIYGFAAGEVDASFNSNEYLIGSSVRTDYMNFVATLSLNGELTDLWEFQNGIHTKVFIYENGSFYFFGDESIYSDFAPIDYDPGPQEYFVNEQQQIHAFKVGNGFTSSASTENSDEYVLVEIYPNPVSDEIFVLNNNSKQEIHNISIYDNSGRIVKELNKPTFQNQISMSNMASGAYFIVVSMSEMVYHKKIIKQ